MNFLNGNDLDELGDKIYEAIGYAPALRSILISNINRRVRDFLATDNTPPLQLSLDLLALNSTPRLTDGTIPFESWLEKVSRYVKPYPEASDQVRKVQEIINKEVSPVTMANAGAPSNADIDNMVKEKIVHKNDMVSYMFLEGGFNAGNAVARIMVKRYENGHEKKLNGEPATYLGTGWLLTNSLIITNHHVVNAREKGEQDPSAADFTLQCTNTQVQFDYNADNMQGIISKIAALEATDKQLDYAILRLQQPVNRKPLLLLPEQIIMPAGETPVVNIIQHPFGNAKKVALRNNHIYDTNAPNVRYFTDTEGGSSGSPVFNDTWQVIAMHKASTLVNNVNYNGQQTAWVNEGVQLKAIVDHLKANNNALAEEIGIQ